MPRPREQGARPHGVPRHKLTDVRPPTGTGSGNGSAPATGLRSAVKVDRSSGRPAAGRGFWTPWRRWVVAAVLVLLPTAIAAQITSGQRPTYAAVADILYVTAGDLDADAVERQLATQEVVLVNRTALETTAKAVGRDPTELAEAVSVEGVEDSTVLRLRVEDHSRAVAQAAAQSLVDQYTVPVQQRAEAALAAQKAAIDGRTGALTSRLADIGARLQQIAATGLVPPATLQAEQRALEDEASVLRRQLADLQEEVLQRDLDPADGSGQIHIVAAPALLPEPVGPQPLRAAAAGALLGLFLAFLLLGFTRPRNPGNEAAVVQP